MSNSDAHLDLLDSAPIDQNEVYSHGVVINVPMIFVACEDQEGKATDRTTENLRVIPFATLTDYMHTGLELMTAESSELQHIIRTLTTRLSEQLDTSENTVKVLQLMEVITKMLPNIDLNDPYFDSLSEESLTFDPIMQYVNDPSTSLLISVSPAPYENYQFYSQIPDQRLVEQIRITRNDTDMNRYHRCMQTFEKALTFTPGYVFNSTLRLIALSCLYLCLIVHSRPIRAFSRNDLRANYIGYVLDCCIRSRVIQAWRAKPSSKILLSDIAHNYNQNQMMVNLCKYETAKDRAKYILSELQKQEKISAVVSRLSYEQYERVMSRSKQEIDGAWYYVFDNAFVISIVTIDELGTISQLVEELGNNQ